MTITLINKEKLKNTFSFKKIQKKNIEEVAIDDLFNKLMDAFIIMTR